MQALRRHSKGSLKDIFQWMHRKNRAPDFVEDGFQAYISVDDLTRTLQNCKREKDHVQASQVHVYMREKGLDTHELLGNYLLSVLAELGNIFDAQKVFDSLPHHDSQSWNPLLLSYVKNGYAHEALSQYQKMQKHEFEYLNDRTFVALIKASASLKDIRSGLRLHAEVCSRGWLETNAFIKSILIDMYAKCGSLIKAQQVLERSAFRDVVSWTALITGFVEYGKGDEALHCFDTMQLEGISPNVTTYVSSLKACCISGAVKRGFGIHAEIERKGSLSTDAYVGSALVDMYSKFYLVHVAQGVFNAILDRDVVLWTAVIAGYVVNGYSACALDSFERMQLEGVSPNAATYVCVLKACGSLGATDMGQSIHVQVDRQGMLQGNVRVGGALLDMYGRCGLFDEAEDVFGKLKVRNVISWTALIAGYADHGHSREAIERFEKMQQLGVTPNAATVVCILKACSSIPEQEKCQSILAEFEDNGWLVKDSIVATAAIDIYFKCGLVEKAIGLFDKLPNRDVVSWTALISGYAGCGYDAEALSCLEQMRLEGVLPNLVTYVSVLKAHNGKDVLEGACKLHVDIGRDGLGKNLVVGNAFISMYARCGLFSSARKVLSELPVRDVISWTALMTGYLRNGYGEEAIKCYEQMCSEGISPNTATYVCILKACSIMGLVDKGREIHNEIERHGLLKQDLVLANTLVDVCAKSGLFEKAHQVLEELDARNVFSWNSLIAGYIEHGCDSEALNCLAQMQLEGVFPNELTLVCSLKACGNTGARTTGERLHACIVGTGLVERDLWVGTSLIDMYGKCGAVASAQLAFEKLSVRDSVAWHSLMARYVDCGHLKEAFQRFEQMQLEGIPWNAFRSALFLKLCGMAGALSMGQHLHTLVEKEGLYAEPYVRSSLVDMYTKCSSMAKAQEAFDKFPDKDVVSWTSLMTGYVEHGLEEEALKCYDRMEANGIFPNAVAMLSCLKACSNAKNIERGTKLHTEVEKRGFLEGTFVGNTLVSMYVKCNSLKAAKRVFDRLSNRDLVSWNALMRGYAETGEIEGIAAMLNEMLANGIWPDAITFVVVLTACSRVGHFHEGEAFFDAMSRKYGIVPTIEHYTCVIDLLGRTGQIDKGLAMIRGLPLCPDRVVWRSILSACKFSGSVKHAEKGFNYALPFEKMPCKLHLHPHVNRPCIYAVDL